MGVVSRTIARSLRPKRKPVLQEPLTPGTPLRGGGRAPTISEQTGLERPLMEEQVGTGNIRRQEGAEGERRGTGTGRLQGGTTVGGAALSAEAARRIMDSESPAASNADSNRDTRINPADFPTYRKGSKSAKEFRRLFAEAVRDGKKTFTFEGRKYNTKRMADRVGVKIPKRKPTPSAKKAMGGMVGKKPRNANIDYRKGGMFYVGGTSARVTPINKGKK